MRDRTGTSHACTGLQLNPTRRITRSQKLMLRNIDRAVFGMMFAYVSGTALGAASKELEHPLFYIVITLIMAVLTAKMINEIDEDENFTAWLNYIMAMVSFTAYVVYVHP